MSTFIDKNRMLIHMAFSGVNCAVLVAGALWAIAVWYGGDNHDRAQMKARIAYLEGQVDGLKSTDQKIIGMVRSGQEKTSNRLTALETQSKFVLQGLDEVKAAINAKPRL